MKSEWNLRDKSLVNLCQVFLKFKSHEEVKNFLIDLCTPNELEALSDRWEVVTRLNRGESYREISKETGISTATITRVGRFMRMGKGYQAALLSTHNKKTQFKENKSGRT